MSAYLSKGPEGSKIPDARRARFLVVAVALAILGSAQGCSREDVVGVTVASVTVSPSSVTLMEGESRSLAASVRDRDGTSLPSSLVTWSSSDDSVLSVDPDGVVTAHQPGTAQVRATAQGVSGSAAVTVQAGPSIALATQDVAIAAQFQGTQPDPVSVQVENGGGGTLSGLSATARYADGEPGGWLTLSFSGTTAPCTLTLTAATASLQLGTYHATVTVSSSVAQQDVQITVELTVRENRPILQLAPTAVGFAGVTGGQPTGAQTIQITNAGGGDLGGLAATIAYQGTTGWLTSALSPTTAPAVLTLTADPAALSPGTYTATVQVTSPDAANGAQSVSVSFAVDSVPNADLSVVKTGPATAVVDDTLPFILTAKNAGPRDAVSTVLVDSLPAGLTFVRAGGGGSASAAGVTWPLGIVSAGTTVVDTLWAMATTVGPVVNVAHLSSATGDTVQANNRDTLAFNVLTKPADVAITKTGPATAMAGDQITYSISVAHVAGPVPATGVVVRDALPTGLTFVSATGGGTYDAASGRVTWSFDSLAVGAIENLSLTATVAPTAAGSISNTATVSTLSRDPTLSNNSSTAVTNVPGAADVAVTTTGPATAVAGTQITETITVEHVGGTTEATGVVVTDVLPAGLSIVGTDEPGATVIGTGTVTWNVGSLAIGGSASLQLTLMVDPAANGPVDNTATVTTTSTDPVPDNDSSTFTTKVTQTADLAVSKTGPSVAFAGAQISYTITVQHVGGPSDASGVVVTDALPKQEKLVSVSDSTATYDRGKVTWSVGSLAVGGTASLTITVRIDPKFTGTIRNTATVTSKSTDPDSSNNTSPRVSTTVF